MVEFPLRAACSYLLADLLGGQRRQEGEGLEELRSAGTGGARTDVGAWRVSVGARSSTTPRQPQKKRSKAKRGGMTGAGAHRGGIGARSRWIRGWGATLQHSHWARTTHNACPPRYYKTHNSRLRELGTREGATERGPGGMPKSPGRLERALGAAGGRRRTHLVVDRLPDLEGADLGHIAHAGSHGLLGSGGPEAGPGDNSRHEGSDGSGSHGEK